MPITDDNLETSWSLLRRMKDPEDQRSWAEFYEHYRGVIMGVSLKAGLFEHEAEEVLQETMKAVSKNIQDFETTSNHGSFRAWLLQMARWRIKDQLRKRMPVVSSTAGPETGTGATPLIERMPENREADLEGLCDAEWRARLMDQAWKDLPAEVKAAHYQIFRLLERDGKTVEEVVKMTGKSSAYIYTVRFRMTRALKGIVRRLENNLQKFP